MRRSRNCRSKGSSPTTPIAARRRELDGGAANGGKRKTARLFVALLLPEDLRSRLAEAAEPLDTLDGIRVIPARQLHLTLRFIGGTDAARAPAIADSLRSLVDGRSAFRLSLRSSGAFPSVRRARVLWAGVEASSELMDLQRGVEDAVVAAGVEPETRDFRPHVTIARVRARRPPRGLGAALDRIDVRASVRVEAVALMKSELGPGGARYKEVASFALDAAQIDGAGPART